MGAAIVKVLVLTEYPAPASGLALQGELLCRGLSEMGVDVHPVHLESSLEKEWYYRWFKPDVVVGVGFWGHLPNLVSTSKPSLSRARASSRSARTPM